MSAPPTGRHLSTSALKYTENVSWKYPADVKGQRRGPNQDMHGHQQHRQLYYSVTVQGRKNAVNSGEFH